mgnify:CR=1 FL=1
MVCRYPLYSVSRSGPGGAQLAWDWYRANMEDLRTRAGGALSIYSSVITACSSSFVTAEKVDEVEKFFAENPQPTAQRKISQNLEAMRSSVEWLSSLLEGKLSQEGFFDFLVGLYLDKAETRERASSSKEMDDLLA